MKTVKFTLGFVIGVMTTYLFGSLVSWSFDIGDWSGYWRFWCLLWAVFWGYIGGIAAKDLLKF